MQPTQPSRFSVAHRGPAAGNAYEAWREGICRNFCRLDVGPAADNFIDCRNEISLLHSVAFATPKGASARFARTKALLDDGCDDLVLISALRGTVRVTQRDTVIELSSGQMCLTEMNVVGEADLTRVGDFTTARFPRHLLLQVAPDAESHIARPLTHDPALSAMIGRYSALCHDAAGLDASSQKAMAQHLIDLVGLLAGTKAEQQELIGRRGLSAARFDILKSDTLRNLHRHGLDIETVARAAGMSGRQAQRMFAESGTTFSEFVLEHRLLLARTLLLHANGRDRKISDIAQTAGFNDLSYFNRSFKRRFGETPSAIQAASGDQH